MSDDTVYRDAALEAVSSEPLYESGLKRKYADEVIPEIYEKIKALPPAESEYEELAPEEAAREIVSGSTMSAWHLVDDVIRLEQMGYVICRKK